MDLSRAPTNIASKQVIGKQAVAKSFSAAASDYDHYAQFQHRLAQTLVASCPAPSKYNILDLGCGTGYCLALLQQRYGHRNIMGADLAQGMLDYAQANHPEFSYQIADAENLPFAVNQFDLIFSNLAVQWCDSFAQVLAQAYACLAPGGHLVLSTLADGTLQELKHAWAQVDDHQHVNDFLSQAQLSQHVNDSEFVVEQLSFVTQFDYFDTVRGLTDSLKRIGAHNITQGRAQGLTSPSAIKLFKAGLEAQRTPQGLPARYEVMNCVLMKPTDVRCRSI